MSETTTDTGVTARVLAASALRDLAAQWLGEGRRVVGPVADGDRPGRVRFADLAGADDLVLDGFVHAVNTAKEAVMPKVEKLFEYTVNGPAVDLRATPAPETPVLLLGARPCDAAAFEITDAVMNWQVPDTRYNRRRRSLVVVTLACREWDEQCFCTSVGLGPAAGRGSDVLLLDLGDGVYEARALTDAGAELIEGRTSDGVAADEPVGPAVVVDVERVRQVLAAGFDSPIWARAGLRCVGCGACTFTCPTCHCFDIVDEAHGTSGCRLRTWDSCQFPKFTVHASGHNPRPDQGARQRQRSMHKFVIYPEKFGEYLCTGCGNCFRNCPSGLGVLDVLRAADAKASTKEETE